MRSRVPLALSASALDHECILRFAQAVWVRPCVCALQMFKRGGLEEVCSLLVSVGNEPVGLPSSPSARPQSQGQPESSAIALHGSENAPEAGQDRAALQGSGLVADTATEQQSGQCAHQQQFSPLL